MRKNVADLIAKNLKNKGIKHAFGIIGAGNAQIFDSINTLGFTEIICVHHEQAAVMAAMGYYRMKKFPTVVLLTTGAGSSNAITGVLSAWMDSIPVIIISGNENSKYTKTSNNLRIWGVQGFDVVAMVKKITKWSYRIIDPHLTLSAISNAFDISVDQRPGPVWIDIPMNIQTTLVEHKHVNKKIFYKSVDSKNMNYLNVNEGTQIALDLLSKAKKPLLYLGHGIRLAKAEHLIKNLVNKLKIPFLLTWQANDLIDSNNQFYYGKAGVYGQRSSNFIVQSCDLLICIGTRLAIPQVGYEAMDYARNANLIVVDIDPKELKKHIKRIKYPVLSDAKKFIENITQVINEKNIKSKKNKEWLNYCNEIKLKYRPIEKGIHSDIIEKNGKKFINSYAFMNEIQNYLKDDEILVTDMGTALLSGHQIIEPKNNQRMMTSTGLGEMGYGLPSAIGAAIATNKSIICFNCDGGMMLNLQELQTVIHYNLPIKIFIFNNDGYLMIKHTQKALFNGRYVGVDKKTGVSCPDYKKLGIGFGFEVFSIRTWKDFHKVLPKIQSKNIPLICEVFMHPEQLFLPKLSAIRESDGSITSPKLEDLSPRLSSDELKNNTMDS